MSSVLVAGSTGTLGLALVEALHAAGHTVHALARERSRGKLDPVRGRLASTRFADVRRPETLAGAFDGVDTVITTIGIGYEAEGLTPDDVDFRCNLNVLEAAKAAGVRRFVYTSVVGADRDVGVAVLDAKRRFERALQASGLEWTIVRPSGFYKDLKLFLRMAARGSVTVFGDGQARHTPIAVEDLAELMVAGLDRTGRIVAVGGPAHYSYDEIARLAGEVLGRPVRVRHVPAWAGNAMLALLRVAAPRRATGFRFLLYIMQADNTAPHHGRRTLREFFERERATLG